MSKVVQWTIDVEPDLHGGAEKGISEGLLRFEKICDKTKVKPFLYVVGKCVPQHSRLFKRLLKKKWQIGLHGFSHRRMDDLSIEEKEKEIKRGISVFQKNLKIKPRAFRAPQHSIDKETLDLLEKYKFSIDSSYTPLNALQLLFFPRRIKNWTTGFFSRRDCYNVRKNLKEIPTSAFIVPFVSLIVRVFPVWVLRVYLSLIKTIYTKPVFYAHSWDFVEQRGSRIDKWFQHEDFIKKLDKIMSLEEKNE